MDIDKDFWPGPLAHCALPLLGPTDERVTIGEITSARANGFKGNRFLYTALVPKEEVESVLNTIGGLISDVKGASAERAFGPNGIYSPRFWIDMPTGKSRFESLINKWDTHNKLILLPDNAFLLSYRLVPETLKDGSITWHDLNRPVYDVVRVTPVSRYAAIDGYTNAQVSVLRDYLEDYLSLKECVAIATYFDERYSTDDPEVAALIEKAGFSIKQPARELWFKKLKTDFCNQISQVSASAVLLVPQGKPITNPVDPALVWPDHEGPITGNGSGQFATMERSFVKDEVLVAYEKRPEFDINPESGSIGYEHRWSVGFCDRYGRDHIALELRKLYAGATTEVIRHFHSCAVSSVVADKDFNVNGNRNVGVRANEFVYSFLELADTLSGLSNDLGLVFTPDDISQFSTEEVKYNGWWTFATFRPIGYVSPLKMPFPDFLARCKDLFAVLDCLRKSPLLQIVVKLGLEKQKVSGFESLKLLSTICQLSTLGNSQGLNLIEYSTHAAAHWDTTATIDEFKPLFALVGLRIASAHNLLNEEVKKNLDVFGIDAAACHDGWGRALDCVCDNVINSLRFVDKLITQAWAKSS
jgi:hypothetical protein